MLVVIYSLCARLSIYSYRKLLRVFLPPTTKCGINRNNENFYGNIGLLNIHGIAIRANNPWMSSSILSVWFCAM
jgi:hypothetical protein